MASTTLPPPAPAAPVAPLSGPPPLAEGSISEEELTALALAADPRTEVDPAAEPDPLVAHRGGLPASYMPSAMPGERGRSFRIIAIVLIAVLTTITGMGFCITYGFYA